MDLTSGTRTMASVSAAVMLGGIGLTLHGVWRDQPTHSLAGVVLNMIALTVIAVEWLNERRHPNRPYHLLLHPMVTVVLALATVLIASATDVGFVYARN